MNKATGFICKYILLQLYSFAFGFLKRIHVDIHLQITISVKLSLKAAQYNLIKLCTHVYIYTPTHTYILLVKILKTLLLLYMQQILQFPSLLNLHISLLKLSSFKTNLIKLEKQFVKLDEGKLSSFYSEKLEV